MKITVIVFLFTLVFFGRSTAQKVNLLTIDQLEDRFSNGKDTLYAVNFWATWCSPCLEEIPYFETLQSTYSNEPLKVLMVSVDFKSKLESSVKPFVKKKNLQNEVFLLNEKDQQVYINRISKEWSGALPATLFVNQTRNIRKLYEQEFSYSELEKIYQKLK